MGIQHLSRLIPEQAARKPQKIALRYREPHTGLWESVSWKQFDRSVLRTAAALLDSGLKEFDSVGLFSLNRPECLYVDYAAYSIRAKSIPLYATSTAAQLAFILEDAGIELLFVGGQYQYDRAHEVKMDGSRLKQIVVLDPDVRLAISDSSTLYFSDFIQRGYHARWQNRVEEIRKDAMEEDVANILYTSGTSGQSKGVILTHAMFLEAMRVNDLKIPRLRSDASSMCFLPMTHIFEKAWDAFCLIRGIRLDINEQPTQIQMVLKETHPNCMCAVPRFWEKVHEGIQSQLSQKSIGLQKMFERAIHVGEQYNIDYKRQGLRPSFRLTVAYQFYNHLLFKTIRKKVGLDRGEIFPVAGARFSDELLRFFLSMGLPMVYGYGLTESTATVSCFDSVNYRIGTVGTCVDGLEVRISDTGEILLKGKTITPGYHNNPEANAEAFDDEGFFHTGDAGLLEQGGHLVVTDRIKDLFKTSNGKYIAPQWIETTLSSDPYIDMALVIGEERKFVSALIVPAYALMPDLAATLGMEMTSMEAFLKDSRVHEWYANRIRVLQKQMAGYERVRAFVLLPEPFSMESGELTNTLKMRRRAIMSRYEALIEAMYV
ncbi:MAG: long-chain fatty acid--CoA ligase [Bacteroidales bacterium]|nr:long-chain fatty acid--CoA ligase [Bacteroidales bacterium]